MSLRRINDQKMNTAAAEQLKQEKEKKNNRNEQPSITIGSSSKIAATLAKTMGQCKATDRVEVIIQTTAELKKDLKKGSAILGHSFHPKHTFNYINAFSAELTVDQINKLSKHKDVTLIEQNVDVEMHLDTANRWYGTQKARDDFNLTGAGVTIAVLDTGVDHNHVDLNNHKVIGWRDFVNGRANPYDDQGHGTHVASIAAGTGDGNQRYQGVAPEASIVGIKVLNANGSGSMVQIIRGVEWMIENKDRFNIKVATLSLGLSGTSDGTDALSQVVNAAVDRQIAVVVAAGNSGPTRYTIGTPGAAEKAITVGAMSDVGEMGYFLTEFSSRGPTADGRIKPDIVAPGYQITAAAANTTNEYVTFSGTSMACPFVAGTVALMIEANPVLTPEEIKSILVNTAEEWGPTEKDHDYGAGRLRGYRAITQAGNMRGDVPTTPRHIRQIAYLQSSRDQQLWQYQVQSLAYPISLTMLLDNENSDFDLYVYNPNGRLVGYSNSTRRQEQVSFVPRVTGNYTIEVYSYRGSGAYYLDISGGA
ncbi:S8 family serine peptidase [Halalkalibacter urbisdiaboli]|uniref:S8 family serine peptidase n=1 Tax=Halalkalibacter urbisdiaboli TaxID=1960589 RepID=UPI000B44749B|nr:S8 family serine peptidase [Halalkalibacter urbisdiaboli]